LQEAFCKYFLDTGIEGYLDIIDETTHERIINEMANVLLCDKPTFQNHCYILLGLSGAGKSTLINHLKGYMIGLQQGTKVTTRPKRISTLNEGTEHVTFQEFGSLLANDKLIGVRKYHGHIYGHYRDEIENAKLSGKDIFIDSTKPEMALEIKNLFPDYVKIVAIEKNQRRVRENLIKRYEDMPIFKGAYLEYLKRSKEKRLEETVKMEREYEKMASIADFVLKDNIVHIKQRELRNYILSCRESRILTL
jgi:guanylate kinase